MFRFIRNLVAACFRTPASWTAYRHRNSPRLPTVILPRYPIPPAATGLSQSVAPAAQAEGEQPSTFNVVAMATPRRAAAESN